jgi:hypothetical protein
LTNDKLVTEYAYSKAGSYLVKSFVRLTNGQIVQVSLTQLVEGSNLCLDLDKAKSKFHCDMDKDGIPDICDTDIDND